MLLLMKLGGGNYNKCMNNTFLYAKQFVAPRLRP
jgi:hypothetical protein